MNAEEIGGYVRRRSQICLVSATRPTRFLLQGLGRIWSAPLKTEKKLKGRFISSCHFLVIEIGIFLT